MGVAVAAALNHLLKKIILDLWSVVSNYRKKLLPRDNQSTFCCHFVLLSLSQKSSFALLLRLNLVFTLFSRLHFSRKMVPHRAEERTNSYHHSGFNDCQKVQNTGKKLLDIFLEFNLIFFFFEIFLRFLLLIQPIVQLRAAILLLE
jgi:hypothetical protein